jgi:type I restriction enzyme S subunit
MASKMGLTLNDVCLAIVDCEHKTAPTQSEGDPSIRTPNIGRGRLVLEGVNRVSDETYEQWTQRMEPMAGDLILAREAPIGNVAIVPNGLKVCLGQRTVLIRADRARVLPEYLVYLLLGDELQGRIHSQSNGATVHHLNMKDIRGLALPTLPSMAEQRRIASILSAYDDLIENNTRRIAILEEMARRIYEEWFVRFRFPGHDGVRMIESELGLVPEGWSVQGLYDVADLTYGFPFKSNLFKEGGEGLGVIRIRDIRDDYTATCTTEDVDLKYRVADGDILVGMDGAFHMGRWAGGVAWLNQRVVRFRPRARIPRSWLFWVTEEPIKTLEATIVGTTVAHLSARDLKEMRVLVPSKAVLEAAGSVLEPMSDLELTLKKKNAALRVTRDLLLPKLISGELDVSAMPEPEALAA